MENYSLWWEMMKMKLRQFSIKHHKNKTKQEKPLENKLNEQDNLLFEQIQNKDVSEEVRRNFEEIKNELERINNTKTEGIRIRARMQLIEKKNY